MIRIKHTVLAAAVLGIASSGAVAAGLDASSQAKLFEGMQRYAPRMSEVSRTIWQHPELGYLEDDTTALLQNELKAAGFTVETGVAGMPTSFVARAGKKGGPVIAILAEMDALPGFSQAASPQREAMAGLQSGHACGHNLYGAGSVGAAVAIKQWLDATGTPGEIRLYGTPAEEGGSGKVYMVRAGLFKDVDVALRWHPADRNTAAQEGSLANVSGKFRFYGTSAHAAVAPHLGRSALDGVEALDFMVNAMREHVPQETRIHYVITDGGKAPNVVPDFAEVYYYVRHPDPAVVQDVVARIQKAAEGAAMGTGTRQEFEVLGGVYSLLSNDTLGKVADESLRAVGAPKWDASEIAFGEKIQTTLNRPKLPPMSLGAEISPYSIGRPGYSSTDSGDVSWAVPTVAVRTATWVPGVPAHSWQAVALSGMSIGQKGMDVAARTMALTAARLYAEPAIVAQAKDEFDKKRGKDFVYKPLIGDRAPALDYRKPSTGAKPAAKS